MRSRNIGSQIGAGLKSILGGELKGMTKALIDSRQQVMERMIEEAEAKGANAIIAMRFDTSEMGAAVDGDLRLRHRGEGPQGVRAEAGQRPVLKHELRAVSRCQSGRLLARLAIARFASIAPVTTRLRT